MAFAMRAAALTGTPALAFPAPGAAVDIDFVNRRYWWGGSSKLEANFTTFVLNGATFGANGLTPTDTTDVTLALAGLGTFLPGALAAAVFHSGTPATTKCFFEIDNNVQTQRVVLQQSTTRTLGLVTVSSGTQANMSVAGTTVIGPRQGLAGSYNTNDFKYAANGVDGTPDTAGNLPTAVATLRIGRSFTGADAALGSIARLVLFGATKTQAELNALSNQMRI